MRQTHELAGRIALEEKKPGVAVSELALANQQDPRVLYLLAVAQQEEDDHHHEERRRNAFDGRGDFLVTLAERLALGDHAYLEVGALGTVAHFRDALQRALDHFRLAAAEQQQLEIDLPFLFHSLRD